MFKRVIWTGVGYTLGLGTSVYVQRKVRRTVVKYTPEHVRDEVSVRSKQAVDVGTDWVQRVRQVGGDLAAAAREGRAGMVEEEERLKEEFAPASPGRSGAFRPRHITAVSSRRQR